MCKIIYYEELLDLYFDKINHPNSFLSDEENTQFSLLWKWHLKENFTEEELEKFKNELEEN